MNENTANVKWNELYEANVQKNFGNWDYYIKAKIKLKKKFFALVFQYAGGKPLLECGTGTGKFAAYLATLGYDSYAVDIEDGMVEKAIQLSQKVSPDNPVKVSKADIRNLPFDDKFFSVAHSNGVFEHYQDEEIVQLINEQLRAADTIVFGVPSTYYGENEKMHGDERFLAKKKWRDIIAGSNAKIVKETGCHSWPFKRRMLEIAKSPSKIFKPIAIYTFALQDKEDGK